MPGAPKRERRPTSSADRRPFRAPTERYLSVHPAAQRKHHGQYFTPRAARQALLDRVGLAPGMRVLDPGAGTGEFLLDVLDRQPDVSLHGFDIDERLVAICRAAGLDQVTRRDFLVRPPRDAYDLVIGNPPYYEVPRDRPMSSGYAEVVSGRPNVFAMFVKAGLDAVRPGGQLAFVVPPSMNNGRYFRALREYVLRHAAIESLVVLDGSSLFAGALQCVMLLVLRKGASTDEHVFRADFGTGEPEPLFMEDPERLASLLEGRHTLDSLGFEIRTGRCVWNQHKEALRRNASDDAVPLIWSHNIRDGELVLDESHGKPQYVRFAEPDTGPAIVVNRVTGAVGEGGLRAAMIPAGQRFVGENHVNVVSCADKSEQLYRGVLAALRDRRATDALRLLTGNTQLSSRELRFLIPLVPLETS